MLPQSGIITSDLTRSVRQHYNPPLMEDEKRALESGAARSSTETGIAQPLQWTDGRRNRTPLWVLIGVVVGFLLPVCSCASLLIVSVASLVIAVPRETRFTATGDAVAIVRVEGTITSGNADEFGTGAISGVIIDMLGKAEADPSVKAILLRVDSAGGTVTGSAEIYEKVVALEKPVVVSMGAVAASGGYYVSAPADYIFARADTVTGSIGVIMTLFNAQELIDDIGVDVITITSGPNKALGSAWEEMSAEQREILDAFIAESFDDFVRIVDAGRDLSLEEVTALADGRIYSGRQAVANGLADELGNMEDAIARAAELGGISGEPRLIEYEHLPALDQLLFGLAGRLSNSEAEQLLQLINEFSTPAIEYRYVGPGAD
jgi:protease-4